jgi:hypothetical protein
MAVLPSMDSAATEPWTASLAAPVPTSFLPCCVQVPPLRVKTHAAPAFPLSAGPPTMAVLPSAESATDEPWRADKAPSPTSFPCCVHVPALRVKTHAAPTTP